MAECSGAKKATIKVYTPQGGLDTKIVITENLGVEVNINQLFVCWEYGGAGLDYDCTAAGFYTHQHKGNIPPSFESKKVPKDVYNNCTFDYAIINNKSNYPLFEGGVKTGTSFVRRATFDDSCDLSISECGWNLEVKNTKGQVYKKFYPGEKPPRVEVTCDDDCPPDHCKCPQPGYPGYCCLPCKEVANKINQIANKIT